MSTEEFSRDKVYISLPMRLLTIKIGVNSPINQTIKFIKQKYGEAVGHISYFSGGEYSPSDIDSSDIIVVVADSVDGNYITNEFAEGVFGEVEKYLGKKPIFLYNYKTGLEYTIINTYGNRKTSIGTRGVFMVNPVHNKSKKDKVKKDNQTSPHNGGLKNLIYTKVEEKLSYSNKKKLLI